MQRRRAKPPQRFEMIRRAVAFIVRQSVLRVERIQLLHLPIAFHFRQDRCRGNRDAPSVAVNQGFLLDWQIQFDGIEEKKIGQGLQLRKGRDHRLAAGLVDIPSINAARVDFGHGPGQCVFANAFGKLAAALGAQFLRIIQSDDPSPRIEDDRCGHDGPEKGAPARFIKPGDAGAGRVGAPRARALPNRAAWGERLRAVPSGRNSNTGVARRSRKSENMQT